MSSSTLFTSESVSEGHPDKVADQISDAVLDAILAQDKRARVACETMVKTGVAIVAGEITTSAWIDLEALTRKVILDIGYDSFRTSASTAPPAACSTSSASSRPTSTRASTARSRRNRAPATRA